MAEEQGLKHRFRHVFDVLAGKASRATGRPLAFIAAAGTIALWLVTGPVFGFSDTWQLVINTTTTIVTFLMVFLIQHTQNKDTKALQMKLDELIASHQGASNRLIDIEELDEEELDALHHRFQRLAKKAERIRSGAAMSVDKAEAAHRQGASKKPGRAAPRGSGRA